jgi:secondary thiamine-phosphate synthase enzyme
MIETLSVSTSRQTELVDITPQVSRVVAEAAITEGTCLVYVPHTTAAVTINENADPSVKRDVLMILNKIIPSSADYRHAEGNSPAHIKATLVGSSERMIIKGGDLVLGRWQGVFFCEFDGPRTRRVFVQINPA